MPTASSRPIMVRMFSVTPTKYMKPRVMVKQIGIASVTIRVEGQWRRKKNSTVIDRIRPTAPASASSSSDDVTALPWLSITLICTSRIDASARIDSTSASAARETSTRWALRALKMSRPTAGLPSRRRP
ncbi:hypothetical protein G6F32_016677 [Rhizopus arrhizus]|nr:hypothetical protein G6F32_016677 [Rhizopus arrhizus]